MHCRSCGGVITSFETLCNYCGNNPLKGKKFCQECGATTNIGQITCDRCHEDLKSTATMTSNGEVDVNVPKPHNPGHGNSGYRPRTRTTVVVDEPNTLANLGTFCCTPWIGVILYLVWKDEKPTAAESVCYWTIAGVVLNIVLFFVFMALGAVG